MADDCRIVVGSRPIARTDARPARPACRLQSRNSRASSLFVQKFAFKRCGVKAPPPPLFRRTAGVAFDLGPPFAPTRSAQHWREQSQRPVSRLRITGTGERAQPRAGGTPEHGEHDRGTNAPTLPNLHLCREPAGIADKRKAPRGGAWRFLGSRAAWWLGDPTSARRILLSNN